MTDSCRWAARFTPPALVWLLAVVMPARASSPELAVILPRGAQRGTEATFVFNGARLGDAKEVLFYSPGFKVTMLQAVTDNQVKVTTRIAPNCQLGEHAVRLRTATGVSELRTLYVGALPCMDEKEPNNDFGAPQKIPLNVTIHGVVDSEDVDYFAFQAKKGQRVTAEIEGMRLGTTLFDPYVAILDAKRFELAACDDAPLLGQDATVSVIIPADGTYVVQVRDSAYGGNGSCYYRLHVGTFPRPTAVIPAGGKPGEELEVRFQGDAAGEIRQRVKLPLTSAGKFGLFAQDAGGIAPSPVPFRLSDLVNVIEKEPNDTPQQATPVQLPAALNGVIDKPGDVDCYRFKAKKGQTYDIHCYARRLGSPLDSVMTISVMGGGVVAANDDAVGPDSYLRFAVPEDKEYVVSVTDHLHQGGPTYFYRVELTPVTPLSTVSIPRVVQFSQERQAFAVPRGNRFAALVTVARADFGGDLTLSAEGLPPGLSMSCESMPAYLDTIPVVLEAAPEAPLGGGLAALKARPIDPAQKVASAFLQAVELVYGPPNVSLFWAYAADRAAVVVTEAAPFTVRIVEPKVPLVQNGSMLLKVVAERKPGFKGPITVVNVFNPPGVGSATVATIADGQNETLIPFNAAAGAPVRKWKIAVNATATVGNGPVWVASPLATLEVAPPFATFTMERAAAEQGKSADLFCKVQQSTPFQGKAKVKLLGLPNQVAAPDMEISRDTKEFALKVTVGPGAPPGLHKNIFCQMTVMQNGEPVLHNLGGTEFRVDAPIKVVQTAKAPTAVAKPAVAATAPAAPKRLSRLEMLRQEQEEREKAARSGSKTGGK